MKKLMGLAAVSVALVAADVFAEAETGTIALTNAYRTFLNSSAVYEVGSKKTPDALPAAIADSLMFAFDCSNTNGWTLTESGSVKKIPNLVQSGPHAARFLTMNAADIVDVYFFSAYRLYYGAISACKPPAFVSEDPDGVLSGPYLDFGAVGSKTGLFFDQAPWPWSRTVNGTAYSGETANVMTNIGSVIGVYKSKTGDPPETNDKGVVFFKDGGGCILAGADFKRFVDYKTDDEGISLNGVGLKRSILPYGLGSKLKGGWVWTGLQKGATHTSFWTGRWQTLAANPVSAELTANGVGLGNVMSPDEGATSGGQCIAELLMFDRVLSDEETREVIYHLERKWFGKTYAGRDGRSEMSYLALQDGSELSPGDGDIETATFDVPEGESLTLGKLLGGRHSGATLPQVVKTGDGTMTVADAADFGGEIAVRGGTLAFPGLKRVPSEEELPDDMWLRLDASDTSTLDVVDGGVSEWRNLAPRAVRETVDVKMVQDDAARRPVLVSDALGDGLHVIDFGRLSASGMYMNLSPNNRQYQTVAAVVDARIYGGGHLMSGMFRRHQVNVGNFQTWKNVDFRRLLFGDEQYVSDWSGNMVPAEYGAVWVNAMPIDTMSEGYEAPAWQVVALRVPCSQLAVRYLGSIGPEYASGGLRLAELMAWNRPLSEDEVKTVHAYLMKKWLGRAPAGYDDGSGVPQAQTVRIGGEGAAIDVAEGAEAKVGTLVTDGKAVKTGKGTLVVCDAADLSSGLEVRAGRIRIGEGGDVATFCEVARNPALRLDASDTNSLVFVKAGMSAVNEDGTLKYGTTNFVWSWQDRSGRIAALKSDETALKGTKPFWNDDPADLCNGLPTVDFGECIPGWSNDTTPGRYLPLSRTLFNVRSVYMVLGSQAGGGQPLGSGGGEDIDGGGAYLKDFIRTGTLAPELSHPLFGGSSANVRNGELWINGVRQNCANEWAPSGGYDLVELHLEKGCAFNALGTGFAFYVHGGCRIGELIVFERPLSEREKTATRNYLRRKWFAAADGELAPLPARSALPAALAGDMTFAAGAVLELETEGGAVVSPVSVTGNLEFGEGVKIAVKGFDTDIAAGDKLLIGSAAECSGHENVTFDFGRDFPPSRRPYAAFRSGKLYACFGRSGFTLLVR